MMQKRPASARGQTDLGMAAKSIVIATADQDSEFFLFLLKP
jgi:hypothetical protein